MLEVRPALPAEYDEIGALTVAAYADFAGPDYASTLRDVAGRAAHATVLVAVDSGRVVGSVTLALGGGPFGEQADPTSAVVRMLATDLTARGSGVGTALMQACIQRARDAGMSAVQLSTQASMTAAHRIYRRLGFVRTPERDWSPEPGLELLTFALPLTFCGHCGEAGQQHDAPLEPPRFCTRCRRRMVVQVHPTGWSARCVEHGTVTG